MADCRIKNEKLNAPLLLKLAFLEKKKGSKGWRRLKLPRYAARGRDCWGISHDTRSRSSLSPLCFAFCSYLCPIINAYQSISLFLLCVSAPLSSPISRTPTVEAEDLELGSTPKFLPPKKLFLNYFSCPLLQSASSWGTVGSNDRFIHELIKE